MNATEAFRFTIALAEDWLRDLQAFHTALVDALAGHRLLASEWQSLLLPPVDAVSMARAVVTLDKAAAEVRMSIELVKLALAEARLDDAIMMIKQWDLHFEKLIAPVVGEGPRDSRALPPAYEVLKPGTEAVNEALDIRFETIGTVSEAEVEFRQLLGSARNPWRGRA